jgi:hypothetical protein
MIVSETLSGNLIQMIEPYEVAHEIMALVDEFPSEPFSFDRKQLIEKIEYKIGNYTEYVESQIDDAFNLGVDTGTHMRQEQLEGQIKDLKTNITKLVHEAFTRGFIARTPNPKGGQID